MANQSISIFKPKKKLSMVLLFSAIVLTVLLIVLSETGYLNLSVLQAADIGIGCFGLAMFLTSTNKYLLLICGGIIFVLAAITEVIFLLGSVLCWHFGCPFPESFGIMRFLTGFLCLGALLGIAEFGLLCIFLIFNRRQKKNFVV